MALIEKVNVNGSVYNIASTAYTTCPTAAGTSAKIISMAGLVIDEGVTIYVKFSEGNTAQNPTLTVSGSLTSTGVDASETPIAIMLHGTTRVGTTVGIDSWSAGEVVALTFDGTNWIANYNTNITYAFSNGTNKFTVTPSIGNSYDVTVTPSIANNITGSGTSGYLTKFNGENTITNGPLLSSAITNQDLATKFLRQDGTWAAPSYTNNTHYSATLAVGNAATDKTSEAVTASATGIYVNLIENNNVNTSLLFSGAGGITIGTTAAGKITFTGKAGTVTSITPGNGLINGTSGSSQTAISSSGTISIKEGGVTNTMLLNSSISIAGLSISLGGSLTATTLLSALGIGNAVHYIGESSTEISDGHSETPTITGLDNYSPEAGDIVVYSNKEFIWTAAEKWELFGDEGSYALKSNTVTNVAWDSTNKKLTKTINNSTTDIVTASTLKSALSLNNVTNDAQIAKSVGTTKGDIIYFTGSSAPTRLEIGTSGLVLTVSSDSIPAWTTASVDWAHVSNKVFSALYVNATSGGTNNDTAATANDTTYIHLYDNGSRLSTLQLKGSGGTTVASAANSKVITITSKKYKSTGSANALTSLKLKYTELIGTTTTDHDDNISNATATPTSLGTVSNAVLYIKSMYYGTTSVSTGVSEDS